MERVFYVDFFQIEECGGEEEIGGGEDPEGDVFVSGSSQGCAHGVDMNKGMRSVGIWDAAGDIPPRIGDHFFRPGDTGHEKEDQG